MDAEDPLDWPDGGLAPWARRVCTAAAEAFLADEDEDGTLVPGGAELCERAVAAFDHAVGRSSSDLRRGFAVLAFALEVLPVFLIGEPSRMTRLPLARRIAYLEALEASRIGLLSMLFVAFKLPLLIPAFEEGEELELTGFDRPSTVARRKRLPISAAEDGAIRSRRTEART